MPLNSTNPLTHTQIRKEHTLFHVEGLFFSKAWTEINYPHPSSNMPSFNHTDESVPTQHMIYINPGLRPLE